MEIKKFNEYTKEEQVELMTHWWNYYGKIPYTAEELEKFNELLDEDIEFVRKSALIAYAGGVSTDDIINAWRMGIFDKHRMAIERATSSDLFKENEEELEQEFLTTIVNSYNNPEPDVSISFDTIMKTIEHLLGKNVNASYTLVHFSPTGFVVDDEDKKQSILTVENVKNTYAECLLSKEEMSDDGPIVDFTVGEGVRNIGLFNSERLAANKEKITNMIDEVADIEKGPSFLSICSDKNGNLWTGDHTIMDLLVQLGIAAEVLSYPISRGMWESLPGGVPLVIRNHEKDNEQVRSYSLKEFKKVLDNVQRGKYTKKEDNE